MIIPLIDYVLIEPIEDETKTSKGILLPESSKDKPSRGKVVATGANMYMIGSKRAVGQTVIFKKWTNQEVKDGDKTYLLVKFDELMAIVE